MLNDLRVGAEESENVFGQDARGVDQFWRTEHFRETTHESFRGGQAILFDQSKPRVSSTNEWREIAKTEVSSFAGYAKCRTKTVVHIGEVLSRSASVVGPEGPDEENAVSIPSPFYYDCRRRVKRVVNRNLD